MDRKNCWDYHHCGNKPAKHGTSAQGLCPTATETRINGVNGGKNGGRACWVLPQTHCGRHTQGDRIDKMARCLDCEFRKSVIREENGDFIGSREILAMLDCEHLLGE